MTLHIAIEEHDDGQIFCRAYMIGEKLDSRTCVRALGMLEIARTSLLMGRWGVNDKKNKPKRAAGFPNVIDQYFAKRMAEEYPPTTTSGDSK